MNYDYNSIREGVMYALLECGLGYDDNTLCREYCSDCDEAVEETDTGAQYCRRCEDFSPLSKDCPYAIDEQIFMQELEAIVEDFINALKKNFA